jgi:metal-responsive CopG/Arc/MetJ family transcriptional regulator
MVAKRVLISIDERMLAVIDDAARQRGMTRSGFLARAAMAQIHADGAAASPTSVADVRTTGELPGDPRER